MAAVETTTAPAPVLAPAVDSENAAPAPATTTDAAVTTETPVKTDEKAADKSASPKRRPLSNLFAALSKPKKAAKPVEQPKEISEKPAPAVETITPTVPAIVEPATVDIGTPAAGTTDEIQAVPSLVPAAPAAAADTPAATEDVKVEGDKPATSPKESKKQGFFDKLMNKRSTPKKSDEPVTPSADVKEPEVKETPAAVEPTVAATETPAAEATPAVDEAAPVAADEPAEKSLSENKAAKVSRRLSARIFGGLSSKKKESKSTDEVKTADEVKPAEETPAAPAIAAEEVASPAPVAKDEAVVATPAASEVAAPVEAAEPVKAEEVLAVEPEVVAPVASETAVAPEADVKTAA